MKIERLVSTMLSCIISEHMKFKRTFIKKLTIIAPIILVLFCAAVNQGQYIESGSFGYFYTIIFPAILPLMCSGVINKDLKKSKYRNILCLPFDPANLWTSKLIVCMWFSFLSCIIFLITAAIGGAIFGTQFSFLTGIKAIFLIFITTLWQIPLSLFLTDRFGMITAFLLNFIATTVGVVLAVSPSIWLAFPYAITSRLMCPVINVLPNSLPVPVGSPLKDSSVLVPGFIVSIALFIIISALTALWFKKREAK
ncbi:lantibiotic immunity ABC transporter MutE/EpiE family permease subunit [Clostridium neuense]|uniref:Lantibiotic immunity ABC transporter MutE/EpiE family permease subunit n=2 Tax=Clostridium neuense TaxID=1728934 RepID=A0ABW8TEA4_9CLOT